MTITKSKITIKHLLSGLYLGVIALFILFSLFARFGSQSFDWLQFRSVLSGSMEPTIPIGSLVILKQVPMSELKVGDTISFKVSNEVVTHRIIEITDETGGPVFQTKGDDNQEADAGVVTSVLGKVLFHIPKIGIFFQVIHTPRGTWALVLTILTLLLLERFLMLLFEPEKGVEVAS